MKNRRFFSYPVIFLLFTGLLAAAIGLNIKTTALKQRYPSFENPVFLPDVKTVRLFSLGFEGLAADLVWIKGAIYFGSNYRKRGFRFPWMARLLDLATDLDPLYYDVYWYGSSLLPDVRQSIRLLKKGMKYFPNNWKFPEMVGFNYHYYLKDYKYQLRGNFKCSRSLFVMVEVKGKELVQNYVNFFGMKELMLF